ncbi:MAG: hypothetical protein JW839_20385, partial [Candidatus Lokiarchaeota archaeon]|nr:hypothetical protein [Candidatus Lokiarchaeota archaeon]
AADADGDRAANAVEYRYGTEPLVKDTDGDGLWDGWEIDWGSDPLLVDTDGDGAYDDWEKLNHTNPRNPLSFPLWFFGTYIDFFWAFVSLCVAVPVIAVAVKVRRRKATGKAAGALAGASGPGDEEPDDGVFDFALK